MNSYKIILPAVNILSIFTSFFLYSCGNNDTPIDKVNTKNESKKERFFKILILGDSLTEGYGVNENESYPFLLQKKLNENLTPKTGIPYKVINGGISGSTTSGGVSRINWLLKSNPDFLIVALGGNDGLRGVPVDKIRENLIEILSAAKQHKIPVMLAGMKIPPNYGPAYSKSFSKLYETISNEFKIPLIPFLLQGVGGNPKMNLPDRIHPNPEGHKLICQTVYQSLQNILE
jgi:acyl-CoA thioesterase-1